MTIRNRDGRGRALRTVDQMVRDQEAAELRSRSWTLAEIAGHFGVAVSTAHEMVARALADVPREGAELLLRLELAKLDALERAAHEVLDREHVRVAGGRVITYQGEPLVDDYPALRAVDTLLRIHDRRVRLLGLDQIAQVEPAQLTLEQIDRLIAELAPCEDAAA